MTLEEIQALIMFQTNNDADDLGDFQPHLLGYVNDGYDRLLYAWTKAHVEHGSEEYPPLAEPEDVPKLPLWTHNAIADWATWLVYRNGNPQKQGRGMQFRYAFDEVVQQVTASGGLAGQSNKVTRFYNIP